MLGGRAGAILRREDTPPNTMLPKLEDDECGWDASVTPVRYMP